MKNQLRRLAKNLEQPREEPAPAKKAVVGRKDLVHAAARHGVPHGTSLKESLELQKQLRQLTHQVLVAQEDERRKISQELQDEIAQTLMGINVRLLLLKQTARSKARGLKREIASAQQLVLESAMVVRRLARELDEHQLTPSELSVTAI